MGPGATTGLAAPFAARGTQQAIANAAKHIQPAANTFSKPANNAINAITNVRNSIVTTAATFATTWAAAGNIHDRTSPSKRIHAIICTVGKKG